MKLGGWVRAALQGAVVVASVAACASPGAQEPATPATGMSAVRSSGAAASGGATNAAALGGAAAAVSGAGPNGGAGAGAGAGANTGAAANGGPGGAAAAPAANGAASGAGPGAAGTGPAAGSAGQTSAAIGCDASWLFCDDFETKTTPGMPPSGPWTIEKNGMGSVSIDAQTAAHSGKSSVKVSSDGGYQTFFALTGAPLFPHDGPLYLRLYIKLEAAMTSGHNTYYKAGASGSPSSEHETRMGVMNGMLMINQPAGDRGFLSNEEYYRDGNKPGVVFAPMKWECVETFFDPGNKTIDVWVNGNEVKDLHRTDWEQDPIGALHFGFEKYAGPDAVIWYDDIAVHAQRIGCN